MARPPRWTATNQFTGDRTPVDLPGLALGEAGLGQNTGPCVPALLVDEATRLAGGTATVFPRIAAGGRMLRVATTVIAGKTYRGRVSGRRACRACAGRSCRRAWDAWAADGSEEF